MSSLLLEREGAVAHLRLNRPERLNAIDQEMLALFSQRCREIEHDPAIRVVILSGEGRAFCSGGDIKAWSALSPEDFGRIWIREGNAALDTLARLACPVIAVLDGHVLGGGLELAACADYRIAERQIRIGQPETGLGVVPGWSGTQRVVRRFGSGPVRRMVLFGEVFSAGQGLELGLVDRVVETGGAYVAAASLAADVQKRASQATEIAKMMINSAEGEEEGRVVDTLAGALTAGSRELGEGLAAFREKRPPRFGEPER